MMRSYSIRLSILVNKMNKENYANNINKYVRLIAAYLNNKILNESIDDNLLSFYIKMSKHHSLTALLYKTIVETHSKVNPELLKKLEQHYYANLRKHALFEQERNDLFKYLDDNKIDYLPLKGLIVKDYYPDPFTREFADNDILFKGKDELIKKFFVDKDYEVELYKKSNHDVYLKKPFYNFEMHRELFMEREDLTEFVKYFKNYLDKAPIKKKKEHYLSNEDFYIYFTAHSYKHYSASGCGIRTLVDYYLYLRNNKLDFKYINKELEKLNLLDFSNQMINLSNKVFNEETLDNDELETLLFIASSGTYGTLEHSVTKGIKKKGKFGYTMSRIFPPYSFYKTAYPWAYHVVILIPVAWTIRLFKVLFTNPKKAVTELKMIKDSKEEKE